MQLARCRAVLWAMWMPIDHDAAHTADSLAAVVIEGDRLLARTVEMFVHLVEHLEERGIGADVLGFVGLEFACSVCACLAPDLECQVHYL